MITRIVEYCISCDNWDGTIEGPNGERTTCRTQGGYVYGWHTRQEAIDEAPKFGWVKLTRNRWLCKHCAEKLLPKELAEANA